MVQILYLDLGGGYADVHDNQNLSNWAPFSVCQLYLSKKMKKKKELGKGQPGFMEMLY